MRRAKKSRVEQRREKKTREEKSEEYGGIERFKNLIRVECRSQIIIMMKIIIRK